MLGNNRRDGNTAPRKPHHYNVLPPQVLKFLREVGSSFFAVLEHGDPYEYAFIIRAVAMSAPPTTAGIPPPG